MRAWKTHSDALRELLPETVLFRKFVRENTMKNLPLSARKSLKLHASVNIADYLLNSAYI